MEGILERAGVFLREQLDGRVLRACDNPDSLALVKTRLGDRVHHLKHDWILGTTGSSFSLFAGLWGRKPVVAL